MTSGITGGAVYDLVSLEPMVYNEYVCLFVLLMFTCQSSCSNDCAFCRYEVFANIENGNSYDFNRMSAKAT